jgi:hypothetical protein
MEIKGREGARGGEEKISRKVTKGQSVKRICCKMIFMARGAIKKCKRSSNQQKQSQNQLNFASNLASHGNKSSNREGNAIEKLNFNLLSAAELFSSFAAKAHGQISEALDRDKRSYPINYFKYAKALTSVS